MTTFAEEVAVASVGELNGYARTIVIGLHHQLEVVLLGCRCRELGVDMELTLPLTAAHSLRKNDLVSITIVGSHWLVGQLAPAVVGKPVAE